MIEYLLNQLKEATTDVSYQSFIGVPICSKTGDQDCISGKGGLCAGFDTCSGGTMIEYLLNQLKEATTGKSYL